MTLTAQVALFLGATVVVVPLFRWLKLGAVLGYLAAGVVIGPHVLGFISDPESVLTASEFGVVMLLFTNHPGIISVGVAFTPLETPS